MLGVPYTPYSNFLSRHFAGHVQKLPVDNGATCPVRDGTLGWGGCAFCNGRSFVPPVCADGRSVRQQLEAGKRFFERKGTGRGGVSYLAYFQAGSNTYAPPVTVAPFIEECLKVEGVVGVVLATRPDCVSEDWLRYLERLSWRTFVMLELGVESANDKVLNRVGRGHTFGASAEAIRALAHVGISVGVHTILGLPGESRASMLEQAGLLSALPVDVLKLHQLQIVRGSRLAAEYERNPEQFALFDPDSYVTLVVDYLERLSPRVAVERFVAQAPPSSLIAPHWGLKNDVVVQRVVRQMRIRQSWQGKFCTV